MISATCNLSGLGTPALLALKTPLLTLVTCAVASLIRASTGPELLVEVGGIAAPYRTVNVAAARDGLLAEVRVERGDEVSEGQIVALLDLRVEQVQHELAQTKARSEAALKIAEVSWKRKTDALTRQQKLHEGNLVATEVLDALRAECALAEWSFRKAEEDQARALLELKRSAAIMEQGRVRSPVSGVVTKRYLSRGELATRSGQSAIFEVAQLDPLRIEVNVPVRHQGEIQVGDHAQVSFLLLGAQTHDAVVTIVDPIADTASNTIGVRLELPNPEHQIPAGLECTVKLFR